MAYKSDIEIAQATTMEPIEAVAAKIGLVRDDIEFYGKYKAKVDYNLLHDGLAKHADGKLVLDGGGTNVEGDWDDVMAAIKRCHEVLHAMGVVRISTNIRIGTRTDRDQSMQQKVESVERKLKNL